MRILLCLVLCLPLAAADDAVLLLSGERLTGALTLSADAALIGDRNVPLIDVDRVQFSGEAPVAAAEGPLPGVWLTDGSWLPGTVSAVAATDTIGIAGFAVPLTAVRGWGEALPSAASSDRLVLVSGEYDVRITGIVAGQLRASSAALGDLDLALADVRALRLAGSDRASEGLILSAALVPQRPALRLLPGTQPRLAVAPACALAAWPAGLSLRVEGGRRVWLSMVKPDEVSEAGAFGRTWPYGRDQALEGGPILLDGVRYDRGLSLHARCRLVWNLDGQHVRLRAQIGIADEVGNEGDCTVVISGDGRPLWQRDHVSGRLAAEALDLDLSSVQRLEINVDFGDRYDIGDRLTLADAYVVKR